MKLTVQKQALMEAVAKVVPTVENKPAVPILSGILFKTSDNPAINYLELEASNNHTDIKVKIPAEVEKPGSCVLSAKNLSPIVQKLTGDIVSIETTDAQAIIKSEATTFELFISDAADFPTSHFDNPTLFADLPAATFKNFIQKSTFAVGKDDSRPIFQGVNFAYQDDCLRIVATNTHRLSLIFARTYDIKNFEGANFVVPADVLNHLAKILGDNGDVHIQKSNTQIQFQYDSTILITRLIDGNFPPADKVFKFDPTVTADVDFQNFKSALERAILIARNNEYNTIALKFNAEGLELYSNSVAAGKFVEHLNAAVTGEIDIAFNINYLIDFCKVLNSTATDELHFGFSDPLAPAKIIPSDNPDFIYVVTPVRR